MAYSLWKRVLTKTNTKTCTFPESLYIEKLKVVDEG